MYEKQALEFFEELYKKEENREKRIIVLQLLRLLNNDADNPKTNEIKIAIRAGDMKKATELIKSTL